MHYVKYVESVLSKNPLFVVGSGISCGGGISGMTALGKYLIGQIETHDFTEIELKQWYEFKDKIESGYGLEKALQELGEVSAKLTNSIVYETWKCISTDEVSPTIKMIGGEDDLGFIRLFTKYASTTVDCINIITTNYDHLIEVSAAISNWEVWDGFGNGMLSESVESRIFNKKMRTIIGYQPRKTTPIFENTKHIKIYKPHGSLSWFKKPDNSFVKVSGVSLEYINLLKEARIEPVIITPGIGKYLETHYEPYTNVMAEMKGSIHNANAMVILGFGFNDEHIQASFQSVLRNPVISKVIATMELTDTFHDMVAKKEINNFVAIEKHGIGSRVLSDQLSEDFIYEDIDCWSLKGLLNIIWGEE